MGKARRAFIAARLLVDKAREKARREVEEEKHDESGTNAHRRRIGQVACYPYQHRATLEQRGQATKLQDRFSWRPSFQGVRYKEVSKGVQARMRPSSLWKWLVLVYIVACLAAVAIFADIIISAWVAGG